MLVHQYIKQLQEKIRDAVFGNVGTMISFRVGTDDAHFLYKEFHPFKESDLINLPNHNIYIKLMVDGITSEAFSGVTLPVPLTTLSDPQNVIKESRNKFCTARREVELVVLRRTDLPTIPKQFQNRLF